MLIRPLRPLDAVALASFRRRAGGTEIAAHTWPRVEPESGRVPYLQLVSGSLAQRLAGTLMRIEEVPALPMFRNNTAAFVHALPDGAIAGCCSPKPQTTDELGG